MLLNGKRVGHYFPLSEHYSMTLTGVAHGDEAVINLARLADYTFVVSGTLQHAEIEEPVSLVFRFDGKENESVVEFRDDGTLYLLSVAFITVEQTGISVCFRLVSHRKPTLFLIGGKEKGVFDDTSSSSSSSSEEDSSSPSEESSGEASSTTEEATTDKPDRSVFILGVQHDRGEQVLEQNLPSILYYASGHTNHSLDNLTVFWESERFNGSARALVPKQTFELGKFELPLEGVFQSALQFALSAYVLYLVRGVDRSIYTRETVRSFSEDDVAKWERRYGKDGCSVNMVTQILRSLIEATTQLGREDSLTAVMFIFQERNRAEKFLSEAATLFLSLLTEEMSNAFNTARLQYEKHQQGQAWYFTPFFKSFTTKSIFLDRSKVRSRAHHLRAILTAMVRQLIRGPDNDADIARLSAVDSAPVSIQSYDPLEISQELTQMARGNHFVVDEKYFAKLHAIVYQRYGHIGSALFIALEEAVADTSRILNLTRLTMRYRDIQSYLHVDTVLGITDKSRAIIVVGSGHVNRMRRLFRQSGDYDVEHYTMYEDAAEEVLDRQYAKRFNWPAVYCAYLALEALDAWLSLDSQVRLQLLLFLHYGDELKLAKYNTGESADGMTLRPKDVERWYSIMNVWFHVLTSYSPYKEQLLVPASDSSAALDKFNARAYPPALHTLLLLLRKVDRPLGREPGEPLPLDSTAPVANEVGDLQMALVHWHSNMKQAFL